MDTCNIVLSVLGVSLDGKVSYFVLNLFGTQGRFVTYDVLKRSFFGV